MVEPELAPLSSCGKETRRLRWLTSCHIIPSGAIRGSRGTIPALLAPRPRRRRRLVSTRTCQGAGADLGPDGGQRADLGPVSQSVATYPEVNFQPRPMAFII